MAARYLSFDVGYKNMGVCLVDLTDPSDPDIMHWSCDCVYNSDCNRQPTIADLVLATTKYVHNNAWMYCIADVVLIEQQMDENFKMRGIACALQAALLSCAWSVGHNDLTVLFVSPRLKLGKFSEFCVRPRKSTYRQRKEDGVLIANGILQKWGLLQSYEGKFNFDMADAFANLCAYAL